MYIMLCIKSIILILYPSYKIVDSIIIKKNFNVLFINNIYVLMLILIQNNILQRRMHDKFSLLKKNSYQYHYSNKMYFKNALKSKKTKLNKMFKIIPIDKLTKSVDLFLLNFNFNLAEAGCIVIISLVCD